MSSKYREKHCTETSQIIFVDDPQNTKHQYENQHRPKKHMLSCRTGDTHMPKNLACVVYHFITSKQYYSSLVFVVDAFRSRIYLFCCLILIIIRAHYIPKSASLEQFMEYVHYARFLHSTRSL